MARCPPVSASICSRRSSIVSRNWLRRQYSVRHSSVWRPFRSSVGSQLCFRLISPSADKALPCKRPPDTGQKWTAVVKIIRFLDRHGHERLGTRSGGSHGRSAGGRAFRRAVTQWKEGRSRRAPGADLTPEHLRNRLELRGPCAAVG